MATTVSGIPPSQLADFAGVYTTNTGSWGTLFSPLIVNDDGTFNVAGALATPTYVPENNVWGFGPLTVTGVSQTATISGQIGFFPGTPATFKGAVTVEGFSKTYLIGGTQLTDVVAPVLAAAVNAAGLLDVGDRMTITADNGSFLVVASDGSISATGAQSDAAMFVVTTIGTALTLATDAGQPVTVDATGQLKAIADATPTSFVVDLSCTGNALFSVADGGYWTVGDDSAVLVDPATTLSNAMQFSPQVQPVSFEELCARHGIDPEALTAVSPCTQAQAMLAVSVVNGLFVAAGLGPFMLASKAASRMAAIMMSAPTLLQKFAAAAPQIANNPSNLAAITAPLLVAVAATGNLLWLLFKSVLVASIWATLFWAAAKVAEIVFLIEAFIAEIIAAVAVWGMSVLKSAVNVVEQCPNAAAPLPGGATT
ncbi:hypothetical protein GCM10023205_77320 [Yinghuangia aomiensis]|uniref:Uncharacterized protein n=1 Tax=Yinghuangia aomiensis TaxID=676205 RepID=A0ABP9IAG6_9ACTN